MRTWDSALQNLHHYYCLFESLPWHLHLGLLKAAHEVGTLSHPGKPLFAIAILSLLHNAQALLLVSLFALAIGYNLLSVSLIDYLAF